MRGFIIKVSLIISVIVLTLSFFLFLQKPIDKKILEKVQGGDKNEEGWFILADQQDCIVLGYTESYGYGESDIWMLKFDRDGKEIANKTYGSSKEDKGKGIRKTPDGYIIVGSTHSHGRGDSDIWVIMVDNNGNEVWNRTYGGEGNDIGRAILITEDGYLILGETSSYGQGNSDFWLIKIDKSGKEIWNKTYGGIGYDEGRSLDYADNGYILAGGTRSYGLGKEDIWVIMVDFFGNEIWNRTFGTDDRIEYANQIIRTTEESFVLVGHSLSADYSILNGVILKINKAGDLEWEKVIEEESPTGLSSVAEVDNSYIAVGYLGSYIDGSQDLLLVILDMQGNVKEIKTLGEKGITDAGTWIDCKYGKCFITGYKERSRDEYGNPILDLWLVELKNG